MLRLLAATLVAGAALAAGPAAAATPTADYRCADVLTSDVAGAPALNAVGSPTFAIRHTDAVDRVACIFAAGSGFALVPTTGTIKPKTYSIVALLALGDVSGRRRLLDFKHGTSDTGLYVDAGRLRFVGV